MEKKLETQTRNNFFLKASGNIEAGCNKQNAFIADEVRNVLRNRNFPEEYIEVILQSGRFCNIRSLYMEIEKMSKVLFQKEDWTFLPYDMELFCDILLDYDAEYVKCYVVSYNNKRYLAFRERTKERREETARYIKDHNLTSMIIPTEEVLCNI